MTVHSSKTAERLTARLDSGKALLFSSFALWLVGVAIRLALWICVKGGQHLSSEGVGIATSLLRTGRYADAYGAGVGLTAHCAPLHPLFLAGLFGLFGMNAGGQLAMDASASAASALAFSLLPILAVRTGLPVICGILAGAAGELLLFDFWFQATGNYDGPFTAAALVGLTILVCRICGKSRFTKREAAVLGFASGMIVLLNPVILPIIVGWLIGFCVANKRQLARILGFCATTGACLLITLAPWAIRNYEALGSLIWTRSNFWLEMQVSNNGVLTADLERNQRMPEFALFHPYAGAAQRAEVKRLGEVAYMRAKRKQALAWITTHKLRFLQLTAERFRLFWIPTMRRPFQMLGEASLTILGLSGLVLLFRSRKPYAWIFGPAIVLYPLVYYLIQVTPRYRLPLEPFLFLLGAYCIFEIADGIGARRQASEASAVSLGL